MKTLLEQQISNHPLLPNIKRKVAVYGANINGRFSQIVMDAEVKYFDENDADVSHFFNGKLSNWLISNKEMTTVRDEKGQPVPNPNYKPLASDAPDDREENEKEEYQKSPSFDYFFSIIQNPKSPNLIKILQIHILENDKVQFFDIK